MSNDLRKLDDRIRQLEQRTHPPRYDSLDQVADVLSATRLIHNTYASSAPGHKKIKEFVRYLPKEGRQMILYIAKLIEEIDKEKQN